MKTSYDGSTDSYGASVFILVSTVLIERKTIDEILKINS